MAKNHAPDLHLRGAHKLRVGLHYPNSNAVTFTVMLVVLLAPVVASLVAFIWGADIRRAGEAGVLPHNPI